MEFDNFNPSINKNIGFRNLDVRNGYDIYKLNCIYFGTDIKNKLFTKT